MAELLFGADSEALPVLRSQDNAFIEAAAWGNNDLVERLLKKGTNVDATDTKYRNTALHWAASRSHLDVVKLLVNVGANVDGADQFGSTPLFWAVRRGSPEVVRFLLESGAAVDTRDNDGKTPLMVAAVAGRGNCGTPCSGRRGYQRKKQLRLDTADGSLF